MGRRRDHRRRFHTPSGEVYGTSSYDPSSSPFTTGHFGAIAPMGTFPMVFVTLGYFLVSPYLLSPSDPVSSPLAVFSPSYAWYHIYGRLVPPLQKTPIYHTTPSLNPLSPYLPIPQSQRCLLWPPPLSLMHPKIKLYAPSPHHQYRCTTHFPFYLCSPPFCAAP